jgi:SAM-dependent methyltransferase
VSERDHHDQFYGADAQRIFSSPLYRALLEAHARFLAAATPELAGARILSLGCGDGRREILMAAGVGEIVGIDISPIAIELARRDAAARGVHNVRFEVGDSVRLSAGWQGFDGVWCAGFLHHLSDADIPALLGAARGALRAGGRFVSMDPNAWRAVNLLKPLFRRAYDRHHSTGERELRPGDVVRSVTSAGFRDVEVRYTDAFISPLAWLFPHLPAPLAPALAGLDQLLVRTPLIQRLSSGFAVVARNPTETSGIGDP